jgi:transcription-repair coupling factor (superfamily II helicase)
VEIKEIHDEFEDRFGPFPEEVENLVYQLKVKLLAQTAGLASVTLEGEQIVFRYPPTTGERENRQLHEIGYNTRAGKNAYRYFMNGGQTWAEDVLKILEVL